MGDHLRIMGIYAHPADVATEAAGTMAIHADRGDEVSAVVLSDGIRMHPHFLTVGEGVEADERVDSNAFAGIYATRAMHLAATLIPAVDGAQPHFVKELYFFLMDQSMDTRSNIDTPGIVADFFVDTTAVIERKVQAFDQYVSQGYEGQFARKVVEARDGRHGMHAEASYAEPFLPSRSVTYDALPVSPRVLDSAYVANNLPGDRLLAYGVPSATPPDAYRLRRRDRPPTAGR